MTAVIGPPVQRQIDIIPESFNLGAESPLLNLPNSLYMAVYEGNIQQVKFLLDCGVRINGHNDYGQNVLVGALHIDHDNKRRRMFKYLLRRRGNPMGHDVKFGRNVISWACVLVRFTQVDYLLKHYFGEININEKDNDGMTPLHHATQSGDVDLVSVVLKGLNKYQLPVDISNNLGLTPYLEAKRLGFHNVADLLATKGFACTTLCDQNSFKTSDDWAKEGIMERYRFAKKQRLKDECWSKIKGRIPRLQHSHKLPKLLFTRYEAAVNSMNDISMESSQRMSENSTPNKYNSLLDRPEPSPRLTNRRMTLSQFNPAFTLMDLASRDKGHMAQQFHHSQFDTTKASEYKKNDTGISSMMTILSDQQTTSFRKSVRYVKPETPVVIVIPKERKRVSTLAILFGKDKKGKLQKARLSRIRKTPDPLTRRRKQSNMTTNSDKSNEERARKKTSRHSKDFKTTPPVMERENSLVRSKQPAFP